MVITEVNLQKLVEQYGVVPLSSIDQFSVTLHLGSTIRLYKPQSTEILTYGEEINENNICTFEIQNEYILHPGQSILACSNEDVRMPKGYMGFLQTKGSLARLFITVHCCDGQIEPGFSGRVTFEMCNIGQLNVRLLPNSPVAQMFIMKCSSDKESYKGKYNNSDKPTYSK